MPSKTSVPGALPITMVKRKDGVHLKGEWPAIAELAASFLTDLPGIVEKYDSGLVKISLVEGTATYRRRGELDSGIVVLDLVEVAPANG